MNEKKIIKKYKPSLSRDDIAMLREKNKSKDYRKRRVSDYHIDAA